ncbi:hypothetical protein LguiB_020795 [Lonicera macranthoides]
MKSQYFRIAGNRHQSNVNEITRGGSYRINIDFKVADWVSRELKKAVSSMGERWVIVFPACKNGEGWVKAADALREVVNGRIRWGKVNLESKSTFAEVLRKQSIANVYEKQKTTRVKEGLDGIFKWDKVFVCTKESLWHKWSTIEEAFNRRFKMGISLIPFQSDKAVIQCKAEKEIETLGK